MERKQSTREVSQRQRKDWQALEQCEQETPSNREKILTHTPNRPPPSIVLDAHPLFPYQVLSEPVQEELARRVLSKGHPTLVP